MRFLRLLAALLCLLPSLAWADGARTPPGLRSGGTGDVSAFTSRGSGTGAVDRPMNRRADAQVSALDYIPLSLHSTIRACTATTDVTAYLRLALQLNRNVRLDEGCYPISDGLTVLAGRSFTGDGVASAKLIVGTNFNMAASAVVTLQAGDSSGFDGIGVAFDQSGATSRATLVQYPWALDLRGATRARIGQVRISGALNGVRCDANCGGLKADTFEIGAFNTGIVLDGPADFVHAGTLHCWPFDFAGSSTLMAVYSDGGTVCAQIGRVDGLDVKALTTFRAAVRFVASGTDSTSRNIGWLALDGDGADLSIAQGPLTVAGGYTTKTGAQTRPSIAVTGGLLQVANWRQKSVTTGASDILVTGGRAKFANPVLDQVATGQAAAEVTAGAFDIADPHVVMGAASSYSVPRIKQSGTGALTVTNGTVDQRTAGITGVLVGLGTDIAGNNVSGNDFGNWSYTVPSSLALGVYGPNKTPGIAFTPVLSFATPGDASITYAAQVGRIYPDANGYRFDIRLVFSTNAFTTASGSANIAGLPAARSAAAADSMLYPISWSAVTLNSGYTTMSANLANGASTLFLRQHGSGVATAGIGPANIKPSVSSQEINLSGFVPTR